MYPLKVKLIKLSASTNPVCPTGNWDTYKLGQLNDGESLPVDYELIGLMEAPPAVGQCVKVFRTSRNGVERLGQFTSTKVVEHTEDGFKTLNSVYHSVALPQLQAVELADQEVEG